ncbi:NAD(P)H-dependent oxidoreductase subunit E [Chloroflexota bacterium]
MSSDVSKVQAIVKEYDNSSDNLIAVLHAIQSEYRYLPVDALKIVAEQLRLPIIQVYSVATFFRAFSLKPRGKHMVKICLGTACHVRGAPSVLDEAERQLGIERGGTTQDMMFTLETVNCLGACALGPIMVVDDEYHGDMSAVKVKRPLSSYRKPPKSAEVG